MKTRSVMEEMRKNEAYLYLSPADGEDLQDAYESKLFEFRQFFTGRFPVSKLFNSKLAALRKLNEAYKVLGGSFTGEVFDKVELETGETLKAVFDHYQKARNRIRQQIFMVNNGELLERLVKDYLEITREYAENWNYEHDSLDEVKVSVETDVMQLAAALKRFEEKGYDKIKQVIGLEEFEPVVSESKRLSLWIKMDDNGK